MIIPSGRGFIYIPQPYIPHPQTIQRTETQTAQPSKEPIDFTKDEALGICACAVGLIILLGVLAIYDIAELGGEEE